MKSFHFKLIGILGLNLLALSGCNDPKDTPCIYNDERLCDPNYTHDNSIEPITFDPVVLDNYDETVLLEEFTGFRCTNCPRASGTASNLKDQYPERLFISGIHCTEQFAAPIPPVSDPEGDFQIDMRTPEGTEWYAYYAPVGLPDGMINRLGTENSKTINDFFWSDRVATLMAENDPDVYVYVTDIEFADDSSSVKITSTVKPLHLENDDYYINVFLLENGIIAGQKDSNAPGGVVDDYTHNHVFRRASNGPWGMLAYHGDIDLDDTTALQIKQSISLRDDWVLSNCHLLVVVSKESTREAIQVSEKSLL